VLLVRVDRQANVVSLCRKIEVHFREASPLLEITKILPSKRICDLKIVFRFAGEAMQTILLAGNDLRLLDTRAAVLSRTGASVVCCVADKALGLIQTSKFDLVVFCHTISDEDARQLSHEVRQLWPQTRILQVVSDIAREKIYKGIELDATSASDPNRLVRCTTELLDELARHSLIDERLRIGDQTVPLQAATRRGASGGVVASFEEGAILEEYYRGRLLRSRDREGGRHPVRGHQDR
jgi:CheY-like chemotaxis protein